MFAVLIKSLISSIFFVIFHHEKIIWNMLEKISNVDQKRKNTFWMSSISLNWFEFEFFRCWNFCSKNFQKTNQKNQLNQWWNSTMFDKIVHVIVDISVINYDEIFQKSLNAFTEFKNCSLICTLNIFQFMHIFFFSNLHCLLCVWKIFKY